MDRPRPNFGRHLTACGLRLLVPLFLLMSLVPLGASGQASSFIPVDDPVYRDIQLAQSHGLLGALNPTSLPYTYWEVLAALEDSVDLQESTLLKGIREVIEPLAGPHTLGAFLRPGMNTTSNGRLDPLRVVDRGMHLFPFGDLGMHWQQGSLVAQTALRHDMYWEFDPDGLDATLRAYMRTHEAYVGIMGPHASLFVGRIATHWGTATGPGLLLSQNARAFDGLHLSLGGPSLSVRALIGELDSITGDGRFTGTAGDDSVRSGSERRWMAVHRLDWKVSDRLRLSFMEGALFSGPSTGLSLKYLNPAQLLVLAVDNRPKNDENNAFLAVGLWARPGRWTVETQLMLDDLDLLLGQEGSSFAFEMGVTRPLGSVLLASQFTAVASRTYNTFQPEGRWTYLDRGIATQFSDFVFGSLGATWHHPEGSLRLEPYGAVLLQGERDLRDPYRYDDTFGTILVGQVERTVRVAVRTGLRVGGWGYASVDAGLNHVQNEGHLPGKQRTLAVVTATLGLRWAVTGSPRGTE